MQKVILIAICGLLATAAPAPAEAPASQHRTSVVAPLISADHNSAGQPIIFPQNNGHVTAAIYEIAPSAALPVHKHPFPRLGYVLAGTLRVTNTDHGTSATYKTGDFVLESVGLWHKGENVGADTLRLLVIDLSEKGATTTIMKR